jgi:hypothetical protein
VGRVGCGVKFILVTVLALLAAFAIVTWWALESGGVAIVETRAYDGTVRSTHVWYAETGRELWLEAGTPENGWFVDLNDHPQLRLTIDDRSKRYTAEPIEDPSGHQRIRELMRRKYGFRDRWVGFIADTSRSIAVRLEPRGSPPDDAVPNESGARAPR